MEENGKDYGGTSCTGVMVSNLPLLFTRGFPSSLHQMKLDELEDFVPFMVRCSLGEENPVPWSQLPRPTWWPRKLPFRIPSASNPMAKQHALVSLVERCYSFHGCEYLLQFCSSLLESMPATGYRFNDNRDGTTSMYHGTTGRLLVTFRNENRDYDKSNHDAANQQRKKLLLSPTRVSSSGTTTAVFQPAATDIYLCDKCENEFSSLREVQLHEKTCCGDTPPSPVPPSPESDPIDEDPEPAGQVPFLSYFKLKPAAHTGVEPYMSPRKKSSSPPRKIAGPVYPRYDSIPISSPLGRFLLANTKLRSKSPASQHLVYRYERHIHATPNTEIMSGRDRCNNRWIVVWRSKEQQSWTHLYCFTKAQKKERRMTITTGLNWRSRRLLSICKPLRVVVKRLQKRVVDRVTRLSLPSVPCIDLTMEETHRNQVEYGCYVGINGTQKLEDPLRLFFDSNELPHGSRGSSSLHPSPQIFNADHSIVNTGPANIQSYPNAWNSEGVSPECDPLEINPGDIIQHGSLQLLRLPQTSAGNAVDFKTTHNHVAPQPSNQYPVATRVAPGPKCSKTANRVAKLPSNDARLQNSKESYMISNSELIELSQGNFDVLSRLSNKAGESATSTGSGSSSSSNVYQSPTKDSSRSQGLVVPLSVGKSQSVPQQSTGVNKSNSPRLKRNAAIEVIELSSDEDDVGRCRGEYSEAANAPSQLDGLACYPHTGAKVPTTSRISTPKNGNSHWSSVQKSHCDVGRVGDLAINGHSPNVLKDLASPVLQSSTITCVSSGAEKASTRPPKRRYEEEPSQSSSSSKVIVLDVSNRKQKVLLNRENGHFLGLERSSKNSRSPCKTGLQQPIPEVTPRSDLSGAFVLDRSRRTPPESATVEGSQAMSGHPLGNDTPQSISIMGESSPGLLSNIVSSVTRGVEYICSYVGSSRSTSSKSDDIMKGSKEARRESITGTPNQVPVSAELKKLLQDECRELNRIGLGDLRSVDARNVKLTRRSVERATRGKARKERKHTSPRDGGDDLTPGIQNNDKNPHKVDVDDFLLHCTDENGNSPSYGKTKYSSGVFHNTVLKTNRVQSEKSNNGVQRVITINSSSGVTSIARDVNMYGENSSVEIMPSIDNTMFQSVSKFQGNEATLPMNSGQERLKNRFFEPSVSNLTTGSQSSKVGPMTCRNLCEKACLGSKKCNSSPSEISISVLPDNFLVIPPGPQCMKRKILMKMKSKMLSHNGEHQIISQSTKFNDEKQLGYKDLYGMTFTGETAEECGALLADVPATEKDVWENAKTSSSWMDDSNSTRIHKSSRFREGLETDVEQIGGSAPPVSILGNAHGCDTRQTPTKMLPHRKICFDHPACVSCRPNSYKRHSLPVAGNTKDTNRMTYCSGTPPAKMPSERGAWRGINQRYQEGTRWESGNLLEVGYHPRSTQLEYERVRSRHRVAECNNDIENIPLMHERSKDKEYKSCTPSHSNFGENQLVCDLQASAICSSERKSRKGNVSKECESHSYETFETISLRSGSPRKVKIISPTKGNQHKSQACKEKFKTPLLKELNMLSKDEWKEGRVGGFHPSRILQSFTETEGDFELGVVDDENHIDTMLPRNLSQICPRIDKRVGTQTTRSPSRESNLSRELANLGRDEWKEVQGTRFHPSSLITLENCQEDMSVHSDNESKDTTAVDNKPVTKCKISILKGSSRGVPISNPVRNTDDRLDIKETNVKKHSKKASLARELKKLGMDEWKEMRRTGFHPSDLVGSGDEHTYYYDSGDDAECSDEVENEPPPTVVQTAGKRDKKVARELSVLLKDECKELKLKNGRFKPSRRKRHAAGSDLSSRSNTQKEEKRFDGAPWGRLIRNQSFNPLSESNDVRPQRDTNSKQYATARSTRSQSNVVSLVEVFTPRNSHREMLQTETAMCVLNFNLPLIS